MAMTPWLDSRITLPRTERLHEATFSKGRQRLTLAERMHSAILNVHESFRRAYALAMSTKHIRSASDLVRFGAGLKVECGGCGNARTFGGFDLIRTFNTDKFDEIKRRSKCSRCGHREARLIILTPPARRD